MKLKTEKDGRLFAIALLTRFKQEVQNGQGHSVGAMEAEERGSIDGRMLIYRVKPQSPTIRDGLVDLFQRGTQDAINGFAVIWTDYLSTIMEGNVPEPEDYRDQERAGCIPPWGSVDYSNPKAAAEALARGEVQYEDK